MHAYLNHVDALCEKKRKKKEETTKDSRLLFEINLSYNVHARVYISLVARLNYPGLRKIHGGNQDRKRF